VSSSAAIVIYTTPFGDGWVAFSGESILELGLPGSEPPYTGDVEAPARVSALAAQLERYWQGGSLPEVPGDLLEAVATTALTGDIYREVVSIPAGTTMTYAAVAESVGHPGAARAVGAAMAANRLAPLIPCHRVVGTDGSLRGYAGGLEMKRHLITMEAGSGSG